MNSSTNETFTFQNPVVVDSWTMTYASANNNNTAVSLQYKNQSGNWVTLATAITNKTTPQIYTQSFTAVTATEFRLANTSATRANIQHSRVGFGNAYPAFLP